MSGFSDMGHRKARSAFPLRRSKSQDPSIAKLKLRWETSSRPLSMRNLRTRWVIELQCDCQCQKKGSEKRVKKRISPQSPQWPAWPGLAAFFFAFFCVFFSAFLVCFCCFFCCFLYAFIDLVESPCVACARFVSPWATAGTESARPKTRSSVQPMIFIANSPENRLLRDSITKIANPIK
jgi:hypothetical protein